MSRTPKGQFIETESLFANAVNKRMNELDIGLIDLADKTGASYEHIRKLSRGLASPSPLMLKEMCEVLKMDRKEAEKLATAEITGHQSLDQLKDYTHLTADPAVQEELERVSPAKKLNRGTALEELRKKYHRTV